MAKSIHTAEFDKNYRLVGVYFKHFVSSLEVKEPVLVLV